MDAEDDFMSSQLFDDVERRWSWFSVSFQKAFNRVWNERCYINDSKDYEIQNTIV